MRAGSERQGGSWLAWLGFQGVTLCSASSVAVPLRGWNVRRTGLVCVGSTSARGLDDLLVDTVDGQTDRGDVGIGGESKKSQPLLSYFNYLPSPVGRHTSFNFFILFPSFPNTNPSIRPSHPSHRTISPALWRRKWRSREKTGIASPVPCEALLHIRLAQQRLLTFTHSRIRLCASHVAAGAIQRDHGA